MPTVRPCALRLEPLEARDVPTFYGNSLFPADSPWNQVVANAPVAYNSDAIISRIVTRHSGTAPKLHADFGNPSTDGALYGIPINVVDSTVAKVPVVIPSFGYPSESDSVTVPIPTGAVIEGDGPTGPAAPSARGDSHLLVYDKTANVLYELYNATRPTETSFPYGGAHPTGQWGAYQVSYWDLKTNSFRTIKATSADAAGLPILPGLVRPDETLPASKGGQGAITHAIRMTVQQSRNLFVFPASHQASSQTGTDLPRMGERFRLKAGVTIPSNWSPEAKAVAQAMKDYGLIVADNGSDMFFTGTPSTSWDMAAVLQVQQLRATDFEVVDLTPVVSGLSAASGSTAGGTAVTLTGRNFGGAAGQLHVLFGSTEAASVTVLSDTTVVAVAPAHAAGVVDVRVQSGTNRTDTGGQSVFFGYGLSAASPADQFTFTATAPPAVQAVGINGGAAQRSRVTSLAVTFNTAATLAAGAFTLTRQSDGVTLTDGGTGPQVAVATSQTGGQTVATLTFTGAGAVEYGSLADGVWVLRVVASKVATAGGAMAADYLTPASGAGRLTRLFGDTDGDADVDNADFARFRPALGSTTGSAAYRADLDWDADGDVDNLDFARFRQRLGTSLP